jgi:hypothetical protein
MSDTKVRAEEIYVKSNAMDQTVSRRLLTAEARVRARVSPCGIYDRRSCCGTGCLGVFWFLTANIIPPWLSKHTYYLEDEQ